MVQELGETTQEMMRADDQEVQNILNRRPKDHYWIVIHHRRTNTRLSSGEQVIIRLIKDYNTKPRPQVGMVILEVKDGQVIDHIISPHDAPLNWEAIESKAGGEAKPTIFEKHPIARSYIYN